MRQAGGASRKAYPTGVGDEEREFVVSHLPHAGQRVRALRDVFAAVRWMGQGGLPVADVARRLAALAGGQTTGRTLDGSGLF